MRRAPAWRWRERRSSGWLLTWIRLLPACVVHERSLPVRECVGVDSCQEPTAGIEVIARVRKSTRANAARYRSRERQLVRIVRRRGHEVLRLKDGVRVVLAATDIPGDPLLAGVRNQSRGVGDETRFDRGGICVKACVG